jgi:hypothetical protein
MTVGASVRNPASSNAPAAASFQKSTALIRPAPKAYLSVTPRSRLCKHRGAWARRCRSSL